MLVRSGVLSDSMSRYLVQRIEENPVIELHFRTEITALDGGAQLDRVTWQDKLNGETSVHAIRHVFVMAGASPRTEWLRGCVALDDKRVILTGRGLDTPPGAPLWALARPPQKLGTSPPRVFSVGGGRSGELKRGAPAVGRGAI